MIQSVCWDKVYIVSLATSSAVPLAGIVAWLAMWAVAVQARDDGTDIFRRDSEGME